MNPPKKSILLPAVLVLTLMATASVVFADKYGSWSSSHSGVQYQYVNQFGGKDWDGLRWHNSNSGKVEVHYEIKLSTGETTKNLIYLEKGETSAVIAIAAGARVLSITVKAP
jgi:hypothetical protein